MEKTNSYREIDRDKLDSLVEEIIFSKRTSLSYFRKLMRGPHVFDLSQFDDIDMSELILKNRESSDRPILLEELNGPEFGYVADASAIWPINMSWIRETQPPELIGTVYGDTGIEIGKHTIFSVRTTSLKEAKKFKGIKRISTKMIEFMWVVLANDGTYIPCRFVMSWIGGKWVDAHGFDNPGYGNLIEDINEFCRVDVPLSFAWALTRRYEWSVSIGMDDSPKLTFTSDPAGLRAMFADRDKPEDRIRRAPLRHWVSEHWRKKRSSPEDRSFILQHLRGATPFKWYGYDCILRPSPYDLELNEKLKGGGSKINR